ncbi:hypothetical protein MTR67_052101 [Solanum verrucosum]|uniref:Integrase catalytic domain-containing protein n=1 Tax=Solanum verrucosum TaxID=315347 RepID=A0AAF0V8I8_SOLVR|nr:hypothetical protein MTR67_052101 [Solanum verrucosum]
MSSWRELFVKKAHDWGLMGNFGINKTMGIVEEQFYWPKIHKDIFRICGQCVECQRTKSHLLPHGLYTPLTTPQRPWLDISMDFILGLPRTKRGRGSIFVVVDRFTMMAHFIPCHKFDDAPNVASLFVEHVAKLHGIPQTIVSDKDPNHQQTNGQTEVVNRTLGSMLCAVVHGKLASWEKHFPLVEFAYNRVIQRTIGMSPFEAVYGFNPLTTLDLTPLSQDVVLSLDGSKRAEAMKKLH